MRTLLFAALAFTVAAPAVAQDATASSTAAAVKPAKEKKICKTLDAISGSRMPNRVCRTEQQWADQGNSVNRPGMITGNRDDNR